MPISIDGSGTLTGISVGGLPDGIVDADMLAANAVQSSKIQNGTIAGEDLSTAVKGGVAKAWVNFNGVGTVAIRDSFNVSSITDGGTGTYSVSFTTAMANTNYCVVGMAEPSFVSGVGATFYCVFGGGSSNPFTRTTSAAQIKTSYVSSTSAASALWDCQAVHLAIFGD
tara:strand:- start:36 stop:542 length:507 start_codon:yes stop_codon:yes gene_type:complete